MDFISEELIRHRVGQLTDQRGVMMRKIGETLSGVSMDDRAYAARATNFFKGKREITVKDINNLARFFAVPIEYLIGISEDTTMHGWSQSGKINTVIHGHSNQVNTNRSEKQLLDVIAGLDDDAKQALLNLFLKK